MTVSPLDQMAKYDGFGR